jgi:hypothetical protein
VSRESGPSRLGLAVAAIVGTTAAGTWTVSAWLALMQPAVTPASSLAVSPAAVDGRVPHRTWIVGELGNARDQPEP